MDRLQQKKELVEILQPLADIDWRDSVEELTRIVMLGIELANKKKAPDPEATWVEC